MIELIENEIIQMHEDIVRYFSYLSQLRVVIYPYNCNTTQSLIHELSIKFGLKVDTVFYHCDDKSDKGDIGGIPILPFSDLLSDERKNMCMFILGDSQDWQLDFWCLEWNGIPCENMLNLAQLDYYSLIINAKSKIYSDAAAEILVNINSCEKTYDLMSDDKSKKVFLRMLAKKLSGCNFYFDVYTADQYFNKDIIGELSNEVFFDVGAYDGDTVKKFIDHCKQYKSIYAFEPDKSAFVRLCNETTDINNLTCLNVGLSDINGEIPFSNVEFGSSHIFGNFSWDTCDNKCNNILSIKGDSLNLFPTFIKMDIEGAEITAIKGLQEVINKFTPKLAVCLYHHLSDLWNIPLLINNINKNYLFKIAHHSYSVTETVLYAVNRNGAL